MSQILFWVCFFGYYLWLGGVEQLFEMSDAVCSHGSSKVLEIF